jgi:hypothetical protein
MKALSLDVNDLAVRNYESASVSVSVSESAATVSRFLILLSLSTMGFLPVGFVSAAAPAFSSGAFGVAVTDFFFSRIDFIRKLARILFRKDFPLLMPLPPLPTAAAPLTASPRSLLLERKKMESVQSKIACLAADAKLQFRQSV